MCPPTIFGVPTLFSTTSNEDEDVDEDVDDNDNDDVDDDDDGDRRRHGCLCQGGRSDYAKYFPPATSTSCSW